ncbi:elongation factor Tu [Streptococcus caprae]|uniref:Elongation factor Tu n=1 Tax=Streptococcus caprae TaxID=1640501 RepID=A0ABV8CVL3_9STRE
MKNSFFVDTAQELAIYRQFAETHQSRLADYITFLKTTYQVEELPQVMVLANHRGATEVIHQIPIPAYTNDVRMVMTPELSVWKEVYLAQLENYPPSPEVEVLRQHYAKLSDNHLLQVIGHELAHWSELFMDDFANYDAYIWFEEGMVEYISRRYFLTDEEFAAEKRANQLLVQLFQAKKGWHSLNDFGQATYEGDMASIFYEYWRSFLTIDQLVETLGSVEAVFATYQKWAEQDTTIPLLTWLMDQGLLTRAL